MKRIAAKYVYTLDNGLRSAQGGPAVGSCVAGRQDWAPIREGFVEFDSDGTVTRVGRCGDFALEENVFDGAVVPGFVNAHCHVELSHLEGKFTKGSGMAGFIDQINSLRDCVSTDEKKVLLRAQMDKMWAAGVSAMADISNGPDSFAAKRESPMYTRTFIEVFGSEPQDCDNVIASARELEAQAVQCGLDASITPHSCYTTSPQLLSAAAAEGLCTGYLSYHSQESPQEEEMIRYGRGEMYDNRIRSGMSVPPATGTSSLEYFLTRLPLAERGSGDSSTPDLPVHSQTAPLGTTEGLQGGQTRMGGEPIDGHILLVHNVCLTSEAAEKALGMLGHVWWAICPLSNLFIHNALPPVRMMRRMGLNICIGTDSLSSNDSLDMVGEMLCLQENFPEIPLGEILSWACTGGACFLGKEARFGSIAPGMRPGLVGISGLDASGRLTSASRSVRLV